MKKQHLLFLVGCLCLALHSWAAGGPSYSYQLSDGKVQTLQPNYSQVFVTLTHRPSEAEMKNLAATLTEMTDPAVAPELQDGSNGFILRLKPSVASSLHAGGKLSDAFKTLMARQEVLTVLPAFGEGRTMFYANGHLVLHMPKGFAIEAMLPMVRAAGGRLLESRNLGDQMVFVVSIERGGDVFALTRALKGKTVARIAEPNFLFRVDKCAVPNDPQFASETHLSQSNDADIDAPEAWDLSTGSSAVTVALCDEGTDVDHEDLAPNLVSQYDAVFDDSDVRPTLASEDHGTACSGLCAARTNNGIGVASAAYNAGLICVKIYARSMVSTTYIVRAASYLAGITNLAVSSHSYGYNTSTSTVFQSTASSYQSMRNSPRGGVGAVVCVAAGNNNTNGETAFYPAGHSFVVAVAATDQSDYRASFSNYGSPVEVSAPGVGLTTTDRTGSVGYSSTQYVVSGFSGTSAACPVTASVVALMAGANTALNVGTLEDYLFRSCEKVGGYTYSSGVSGHTAYTWSNDLGYGRINARKAVEYALGYGPLTTNPGSMYTLYCGSPFNGDLTSYSNDVSHYFGIGWDESGPDQTFTFTLTQRTRIDLQLTNLTTDLDVFLCTDYTSSASCIAYGNSGITQILDPGTYYVNVDGYGGATGTFTLTMNCVCAPAASCASGDYFSSIMMGSNTWTAASACADGGFGYNASPTFTAQFGINNAFTINHGPSYSEYDRIWIDLSQDGDFDDAGELVYDGTVNALNRSDVFHLPSNSPYALYNANVTTRMRVACNYSPFASASAGNGACDSHTYGQTEDFPIIITPAYTRVSNYQKFCPGTTAQLRFAIGDSTELPPSGATYTAYYAPYAFMEGTAIGTGTGSPITITVPANADTTVLTGYVYVHASYLFTNYENQLTIFGQPSVPVRSGGQRCGPGKVQFYSQGAPNQPGGHYLYYSAATGGTLVDSTYSRTWTTPSISGSTNYYVVYKSGDGCASTPRLGSAATVNPGPAISALSGIGTAYPGEPFTIIGANLSGVTNVLVNGASAGAPTAFSSAELLTRIPGGASSGTVTVVKPGCPNGTYSSLTVLTDGTSSNNWRWVRRAYSSGADKLNRVRTTVSGHSYEVGSFANTVTLDGSGAVGGTQTLTASGGLDGMLLRHRKDGRLEWACRFGSTGDDEALGLATDKFNYAYVSGYFTGAMTITPQTGASQTLTSAGGTDMFVAKIHPDGHLVYAFKMGASGNDRAEGVDVAPDGRVYVAGSFVGTTAIGGISGTVIPLTSRGNSDAFLAKFTDIGTLYWVIQGGGTGNDFGYGAAADISGGGYLMGSYEGTATFNSSLTGTTPIMKTVVGGSDGFVLGVSITGQLNWVASMGGSTNENVRDLAPDPRGTGVVAVGGFSSSATFGSLGSLTATGFYDAFAVRLSNAGAFQWVQKAGGFGQDQAWGVRLDRSGNPLVAMSFSQKAALFGASNNFYSYGGIDPAIVKLAAATGAATQTDRATGTVGDDYAYSVDTVASGGFIAAGALSGGTQFRLLGPYASSGGTDGWVARNSTSSSASREVDEALAEALANGTGLAIWPNPAEQGSSLNIKVLTDEPLDGAATLQVYAADGRLVHTLRLAGSYLRQGASFATNLPAGAYQIILETEAARHTGRFIIR